MNEPRTIDLLFTEIFRQRIASSIVTQGGYSMHPRAQVRQIIHRIGASSGQHMHCPAPQNEHGRFPGDPGDFTKDEFVCYKIT